MIGDTWTAIQDTFGYSYAHPVAKYVRVFFEGEEAEVFPLGPDKRWMNPKDWRFESDHILIFLFLCILICILEPIMSKLITRPIASWLRIAESDKKRFTESAWQMCFYAPAWVFEYSIVINAPWFYKTYLVWEPPFPHQEMSEAIFWLYAIQIAWYLHCTFYHVAIEIRKADFYAMLLHHLTALALLLCAFVSGYFRCGVLCLFCLDCCDVLLHLCKILRLVDNVQSLNPVFLFSTYISMVLCWLFFRLILFPVKVIYTALIQALHYGGWINADNWLFFNILLLIIFALQAYWFYLIILSGYKYVRFGEDLDDVRDRTTPTVTRKASPKKTA